MKSSRLESSSEKGSNGARNERCKGNRVVLVGTRGDRLGGRSNGVIALGTKAELQEKLSPT